MTKDDFGSELRRRIWRPFILIMVAAGGGTVALTLIGTPTPLLLWSSTAVFLILVVIVGAFLAYSLVASLQELAVAVERISPGSLEKVSQQPDEISALLQTVGTIATEIHTKEETWKGDLAQRTQVVQQLSQTLQEQAASFEAAINSVDMAVCLFESNGRIVQVNQRFCGILGMGAEKLRSMGLMPIVSELRKFVSAPAELTAAAEEISRKPSVAKTLTVPLRDWRGTLRIYCAPIFGELSSLIGIVISVQEDADTSVVEELKSEFISTVSHELRTPLTAIRGALGLVLGEAGGPVPAPIRELLDIANSNAERMIQLVNDILEVFRIETGKLKLQLSPVDVAELVSQACAKVQKEAAASEIRLETRLAPGLSPVLVDGEQIGIVLEKLISNAIKFSTRGSDVLAGAEAMQGNPDFMVVWVQDFGAGIPLEAQERIFEKFEQAEDIMTRKHQGSGLGLAICRGILEGHGGNIWVKSDPGKGSTFSVSLPVAHSLFSRKPIPASGAGVSRQAQPTHCLVMVVEDDPDTRSVIARMLQSGGHFVMEVASGSQATELAMRHQPDIISLDMILPDLEGLEVLRHLKANDKTSHIPVICVSISDDFSSQALQLGAVQYIRKPVDFGTLLNAIRSACAAVAESPE